MSNTAIISILCRDPMFKNLKSGEPSLFIFFLTPRAISLKLFVSFCDVKGKRGVFGWNFDVYGQLF
jgi:hypothetical protein